MFVYPVIGQSEIAFSKGKQHDTMLRLVGRYMLFRIHTYSTGHLQNYSISTVTRRAPRTVAMDWSRIEREERQITV